jgi:hypothetical protein
VFHLIINRRLCNLPCHVVQTCTKKFKFKKIRKLAINQRKPFLIFLSFAQK